jgi:hypothetical protein
MAPSAILERSYKARSYSGYVQCPVCPTAFRVMAGFVRHLVVDHWWEPADAAVLWGERREPNG